MPDAAAADRLEAASRASLRRALRGWADAARAGVDRAALEAELAEGRALDAAARCYLSARAHVAGVSGAWAEAAARHGALAAAEASVPEPAAKRLPFSAFAGSAQASIAASARSLADGLMSVLWRTLNKIVANAGRATPEELASLMLRGMELSEADATAALAYRARLTGGDAAALRAALGTDLRDARFDAAVRAAIAGTPIPPGRVDRMVASYVRSRALSRLETVARTEAVRARWAGVQAMWEQQIENHMIGPDSVFKFWVHRHDNRVRSTHLSIPRLQPDGVPVQAKFVTEAGNSLLHPGDPSAPLSETINCRCYLDYIPQS